MVLNNMYKNKYNTVQQICVGYDVWEVKWIFVDCIYYVCVCQMCNTMHFNKLQVFLSANYVWLVIFCRASKLYKREVWMDGDYFIHCIIQLYVILVRLEICEKVVSLWLYPMVNFIFRAIISSNCLLQVWNNYALFCQRVEQILHGFDM